jgi:hypothetical protein
MSHWDKSVKDRREFLNSAVSIGVSTVLGARRGQFRWDESGEPNQQNNDLGYWLSVMGRMARPVLENLARRTLRKSMPVEAMNPADRAKYTHLEAFGRLLA